MAIVNCELRGLEKKDKMYCLQRAVWRNGGSTPLKVQCEHERKYPAETLVEAATTPSRHPVRRSAFSLSVSFRLHIPNILIFNLFHHYFPLKNSLFAFVRLKFRVIFYVQYVLLPLP